VKEECEKYGKVLSLKAPRPKGGIMLPGVGKIYVEYSTIDEAKEARRVNLIVYIQEII
jgi:splicing factor U2AF subunit